MRTRRARRRLSAAKRRPDGWQASTCLPAWRATAAMLSRSRAGRPTRAVKEATYEFRSQRTGPLVRHPGHRARHAAAADRQHAAGDHHRGPFRQRELAPVPHRRPAPQHDPAGAGLPDFARGHDRGGHLHVHSGHGRRRPLRLVVQGALARAGRSGGGPADRGPGDQPAPRPPGLAGLAQASLAGLRLLAGRPDPWAWHGHRPAHALGLRRDPWLRRRGRGGGDLASCHGVKGGYPMTVTAPPSLPPRSAALPRLLAGLGYQEVLSLTEHERRYGLLWLRGPSGRRRPERLIDIVEAAGLTGRGGAGFPTGRKMRSVAGRGETVVVANGAEGEPASAKDRVLLTRLPHLVLDGITLAADAVGATEAYLCVHRRERDLTDGLAAAVAKRRRAGYDPVPIQVTGIPGRYVSSEQSSIVRYLNGGPGKPTFSPPRPHERGVQGRPTLVNNVETLAHVALIARHGDRWFRTAGLPSAPGSMLVTVDGAVRWPGVYEIELGTGVGEVIGLAGGPAEDLQALLIGGYFGTWLPAEVAWPIPMTQAGMRAVGGALGAGIVI